MLGLQLALFFVVLVALVKPLGAYMARVYQGQPCGLDRGLGWLERLIYRFSLCRSAPRDGLEASTPSRCSLFNGLGLVVVYALAAPARHAAAQSAALRRQQPRSGVQHGRQLCHQHQLARLRRRVDDELPDADARPDRAELRLGRDRHGSARRADPRPGPPHKSHTDRQLLVRSDAQHALHPAAAVARPGAGPRVAGRRAELSTLRNAPRCCNPSHRTPTASPSPSKRSPMGPAASQIAIKQLGTNGGGFFNVNSAHPYENPTPLANFLEAALDPRDSGRRSVTRSATWSATPGKAGRCWPRCSSSSCR